MLDERLAQLAPILVVMAARLWMGMVPSRPEGEES
jgi:hypothetical protein